MRVEESALELHNFPFSTIVKFLPPKTSPALDDNKDIGLRGFSFSSGMSLTECTSLCSLSHLLGVNLLVALGEETMESTPLLLSLSTMEFKEPFRPRWAADEKENLFLSPPALTGVVGDGELQVNLSLDEGKESEGLLPLRETIGSTSDTFEVFNKGGVLVLVMVAVVIVTVGVGDDDKDDMVVIEGVVFVEVSVRVGVTFDELLHFGGEILLDGLFVVWGEDL